MIRSLLSLLALALTLIAGPLTSSQSQAQDVLTPKSLKQALASDDAGKRTDRIRKWFGENNLNRGANPKIDGLDVAWAIAGVAPKAVVKVVSPELGLLATLKQVGNSDLYAGVASLEEGAGGRWNYEVNGKRVGGGNIEVYATHPDSLEKSDVPHGKLTQMPKWKSKIFEGTERDWWVYVPAQYKDDTPACVMVFQDGAGYKEFVPTVFDNLIAAGDMPVTVGVFINPGTFSDDRRNKSNRSFEYDTLSDQYARFLLEEILPEVEKTTKLRHDAASRAIAGISSGGICAFTVAWERPDEFSKVLSWVGSFTNIASGKSGREGGHNYEAMIRKSPKKAIRVFLQDGANDLDNANGNWPLANQQMAKSLDFAKYDYKFIYGQGFHSNRHGRALLPDSLRWLWRGYQPGSN